MAAQVLERGPVVAEPEERVALKAVEGFFETGEARPQLIGPTGDTIDLPPSLYDVLRQAIPALLQGHAVSIAPMDVELTTNKAADLLNVSRPHLIKLLDRDEIPFHMVGTHRRIRLGDLLEYKAQRNERRARALEELVKESQRLGLYDE